MDELDEMDQFTRSLIERTKARQEKLQSSGESRGHLQQHPTETRDAFNSNLASTLQSQGFSRSSRPIGKLYFTFEESHNNDTSNDVKSHKQQTKNDENEDITNKSEDTKKTVKDDVKLENVISKNIQAKVVEQRNDIQKPNVQSPQANPVKRPAVRYTREETKNSDVNEDINYKSETKSTVKNDVFKLDNIMSENIEAKKREEVVDRNDNETKLQSPQASPVKRQRIISTNRANRDPDPAELSLAERRAIFEKAFAGNGSRCESPHPERLSVLAKTNIFEDAIKKESASCKAVYRGKSPQKKVDSSEKKFDIANYILTALDSKTSVCQKGNEFKSQTGECMDSGLDSDHKEALNAFKDIDEYSISSSGEYNASNDLSLGPNRESYTPNVSVSDTQGTEDENEMQCEADDEADDKEDRKDSFESNEYYEDSDDEYGSVSGNDDFEELKQNNDRLYPALPTYEVGNILHSTSPRKSSSRIKSEVSLSKLPSDQANAGQSTSTEKQDNPLTPMRTLSMYRREQQQMRLKQSDAECRVVYSVPNATCLEDRGSTLKKDQSRIKKLIKELQTDAEQYQTGIFQASQAINLCQGTQEFINSIEQVEADRHLLIATQKRMACLNEVHKLKTLLSDPNFDGRQSIGTVTLSDVKIPMNREFMQRKGERKDAYTHYFLCLVRCGAKINSTEMISSTSSVSLLQHGFLSFANKMTFDNLANDFEIVYEVYGLAVKHDQMSMEKKYHINKKDKSTPSKTKGKNKLQSPTVQSPGGPNAIRSPSFQSIGFAAVTLGNCFKKKHTLQNFVYSSPLEGSLYAHITLKAEHNVEMKNYLNLLDESTGYWQRRWFVLKGYLLKFWRFHEDENKPCKGYIDLRKCVSPIVSPVAYEICPRPNTFMLLVVEEEVESTAEPLVNKGYQTMRTQKYLMCADIREERNAWCDRINEALKITRLWEFEALQPYDATQVDKMSK